MFPDSFQDDFPPPRQSPSLNHKTSDESIRTDLCEGPVPDEQEEKTPRPELDLITTSDRAELIERLKRGESPTWVPNRRVCGVCVCMWR